MAGAGRCALDSSIPKQIGPPFLQNSPRPIEVPLFHGSAVGLAGMVGAGLHREGQSFRFDKVIDLLPDLNLVSFT